MDNYTNIAKRIWTIGGMLHIWHNNVKIKNIGLSSKYYTNVCVETKMYTLFEKLVYIVLDHCICQEFINCL